MRPRSGLAHHRVPASGANRTVVPVDHALRMGFGLLEKGALKEARRIFDQVRLAAPEHPTALTMLGAIAYRMGEEHLGHAYLDHAIAVQARAREAAPGDLGIEAPLLNLLLARGREREAEALARTVALPFNPIRSERQSFERRRARAQERGLPTILVCTVPKSASESLWTRLSAGLGMPETHLALGLFPACTLLYRRLEAAAAGGLIAKEHILPTPHNLDGLKRAGFRRLVIHQRDPRQAVLSWAHFAKDDVGHRMMAPIWRGIVPPAEVLEAGLERVVDWSIDRVLPRFIRFAEAWQAVAADRGHGLRLHFSSFEGFRENPEAVVEEVVAFNGIEPRLFDARVAAAAPDIHRREGEAEEWRRVMTREQRRRAEAMIPTALRDRFGWH